MWLVFITAKAKQQVCSQRCHRISPNTRCKNFVAQSELWGRPRNSPWKKPVGQLQMKQKNWLVAPIFVTRGEIDMKPDLDTQLWAMSNSKNRNLESRCLNLVTFFLRRMSLASMDIRSLNNNAAWNIFRYIGDYLHDAAVVFLLCCSGKMFSRFCRVWKFVLFWASPFPFRVWKMSLWGLQGLDATTPNVDFRTNDTIAIAHHLHVLWGWAWDGDKR